MLERDSVAAAIGPPSTAPNDIIQFYSIELTPTADGRVYVDVMATICEREGELDGMDLGSRYVATIDEALGLVRDAIASVH